MADNSTPNGRAVRPPAIPLALPETTTGAPPVIIFTDGACSGNPGPGGWCAILHFGPHEKILQGGASLTTNNRMELRAALVAFQALTRPCVVQIHTDSEYLHRGVTEWLPGWQRNGWRTRSGQPVKNQDLWRALHAALQPHRRDVAMGTRPFRSSGERARRPPGRGGAEQSGRERRARYGRLRLGAGRYRDMMFDDDYSEMFDENVPRLVRGDTLELAELGGPGAELSTGLILTWRDRLVFGIESRAEPLGARGQARRRGLRGHRRALGAWRRLGGGCDRARPGRRRAVE